MEMMTRARIDCQLSTVRDEDNSVEFVLATEDPADVKTMSRGIVRESLLSDGFNLPKNQQIPLLDCHNRNGVANVLGSVREIRQEGNKVVGRLYFSKKAKAQEAFQLIKEGHLNSGSVGYYQSESQWIDQGQSAVYNNRSFSGPLMLTTKWNLTEYSLVPIPADSNAVARSAAEETNLETVSDNNAADQNTTKEASEMEAENTTVNVEEITRAAANDACTMERARVTAISDLCKRHDCGEIATRAIAEGLSESDTKSLVLEELTKRSQALSSAKSNITMVADENEKFRAAATDGLLMRAGVEVEKPAAGASDFVKFGFKGLAKEICRRNGVDRMMSDEEAVKLCMRAGSQSYSDFNFILDQGVNKSVLKGYRQGPATWKMWATKGTLPNLESVKRVDLNDMPDFALNPEGAEIKSVKIGDKGENIQLQTYAASVSLTRRAILADDLGLFNKISRKFGYRCAQKIEALAYAVLTGNAAMSDGKTLFHSDHGNIATAGALSKATLSGAFSAMRKQKDANGSMLDIAPKFVLVSPDEAVEAEILTASTIDPSTNFTAGNTNFFKNRGLIAIDSPHINMTSNGFYLLADPNMCDTVEIAFLNGVESPTIETVDNANDILGKKWLCYIDIGAAALDFRGMVHVAHS